MLCNFLKLCPANIGPKISERSINNIDIACNNFITNFRYFRGNAITFFVSKNWPNIFELNNTGSEPCTCIGENITSVERMGFARVRKTVDCFINFSNFANANELFYMC